MPVYVYRCGKCGEVTERFLSLGSGNPPCLSCGVDTEKVMTSLGMVKIKGGGGYPFRQKQVNGTAPYTA